MSPFEIIRAIAIAYASIWTTYVVILPLIGAIYRLRPARISKNLSSESPLITVIIPAHNMSSVIARCVDSLFACGYPRDRFAVNVIADHCTDDTVEIAKRCGARVFTRNDGPAGKTYTLAWALKKLSEDENIDLFVVVDATAHVEFGFLAALVDLWQQGEDIVVSHPVVDAENQKWFARCLGLTLVHRNLQNRARQRLRLSAFIEGRGMAYSRQYIDQYGWRLALPTSTSSGTHPTEDWRHAVRAVDKGKRVAFSDDARVITPLRSTLSAATKQGVRWERGRMANAYSHASRLLWTGIRQRSLVKSLAALDAIQPPVAILGALCVAVAILALVYPASNSTIALSFFPLLLFVVYGACVVWDGRKDGINPITVLWAPVYLLWRTSAFILAWGFLDKLGTRPTKKH